jgi:phosphoglycerate dehydrogenase-like enzyme
MKVVLHYDTGDWLTGRLAQLAAEGVSVSACREADTDRLHRLLPETEVLWHVLSPVTREVMERAPKLRLIQKIGVGVNTIDVAAARQRGIAVCNMPGTNTRAVAEHTLMLMLACLRRLPRFHNAVTSGEGWSWPAAWQDDLSELAGKTVGLVGFGAVPRALAPILLAMGANVVHTGRRAAPETQIPFVDKAALLARADIVSLHIPLDADTRLWLDRETIAAMKRGAILVNTARGGLVDQAALVEALRDGRLRAAGLDVFADEPLSPDDPLIALPNVVLTPHIAWLTQQTLERSLSVAVENCRRLCDGTDLLHRIC